MYFGTFWYTFWPCFSPRCLRFRRPTNLEVFQATAAVFFNREVSTFKAKRAKRRRKKFRRWEKDILPHQHMLPGTCLSAIFGLQPSKTRVIWVAENWRWLAGKSTILWTGETLTQMVVFVHCHVSFGGCIFLIKGKGSWEENLSLWKSLEILVEFQRSPKKGHGGTMVKEDLL